MLTPAQREALTRAARLILNALDGFGTVEHENAMNRDTTVTFDDDDGSVVIDMGPDFGTAEYDDAKHKIGYVTIMLD